MWVVCGCDGGGEGNIGESREWMSRWGTGVVRVGRDVVMMFLVTGVGAGGCGSGGREGGEGGEGGQGEEGWR